RSAHPAAGQTPALRKSSRCSISAPAVSCSRRSSWPWILPSSSPPQCNRTRRYFHVAYHKPVIPREVPAVFVGTKSSNLSWIVRNIRRDSSTALTRIHSARNDNGCEHAFFAFAILSLPKPTRLYCCLPHMSINTLIVDDEKPAREELAFLLKGFPEINLVGQGKNGLEAVNLIKEHSPDLVFLDVQMPGLDGFGVLKKLVERKIKPPHVVFATAFDHYAVQAFDVNAVDYVLKPFDKARIAKAIQRARKVMDTQSSATDRLEQLVSQLGSNKQAAQPVKILVRSQQRLLLVDAEDLVFASIEDGLISVVARDAEGTSNYRTLEE